MKTNKELLHQHEIDIENAKHRLVEETQMERNHPKFDRVWDFAYENGHASGLGEVELLFKEVAEIIMS